MIFKNNPKELRDIHLKQKKKLGLTQPLGSLKGIEGLLFEILSKNKAKINFCFFYYFIFYKPAQNLFKKLCIFEINLHSIFFIKKSPSRINLAFLLNFFFWFPKRIYIKINKIWNGINLKYLSCNSFLDISKIFFFLYIIKLFYKYLMEPSGLEPLTPCMPCRCSTNWAMAPYR